MYLRLVRFTLSEGNRSGAQAIASDVIPAIKQQPGCASVTFFGGGDDGECGLCVLWDSQEHADAAAAIISPILQGHLADKVSGQPDIRLFPVIGS
jgi:quinol monooxygenase YgiN